VEGESRRPSISDAVDVFGNRCEPIGVVDARVKESIGTSRSAT